MKILYFGGQKSGKTALSIKKTLKIAGDKKPYYIATYLDNYNDSEMKIRIQKHKLERSDDFITIEEGLDLFSKMSENETYLIDCLSMWILNNIEKSEELLILEIQKLLNSQNNIIFILNDVSSGIIPLDKISRRFVDLTGIIGQEIAKGSNEVYQINYGIQRRIK
jgi:adenosylcobinamide kinase/adenosylcobinamide-phosphate guanylyltransferase